MTYDLDPGHTDFLANAIELGRNSLGNQSPTKTVEEIAKQLRDCPNGARIVVEPVQP